MGRVDAIAHSAQMIQLKAIWNLSNECEVRVSVRHNPLPATPAERKHTIAVPSCRLPKPASAFVLYDLAPESFISRLSYWPRRTPIASGAAILRGLSPIVVREKWLRAMLTFKDDLHFCALFFSSSAVNRA